MFMPCAVSLTPFSPLFVYSQGRRTWRRRWPGGSPRDRQGLPRQGEAFIVLFKKTESGKPCTLAVGESRDPACRYWMGVQVVKTESFGAFVSIDGFRRQGMIHIGQVRQTA